MKHRRTKFIWVNTCLPQASSSNDEFTKCLRCSPAIIGYNQQSARVSEELPQRDNYHANDGTHSAIGDLCQSGNRSRMVILPLRGLASGRSWQNFIVEEIVRILETLCQPDSRRPCHSDGFRPTKSLAPVDVLPSSLPGILSGGLRLCYTLDYGIF